MASNFTLVPTLVEPLTPEYNTVVTPSESMKKNYQNIAATPTQQFKLTFKGLSDSDYLSLVAHYHSCKGQYDNFSWTSVPGYIDTDLSGVADGSNMTGRWVQRSLQTLSIDAYSIDCEIIFEKDI